MRVLSYDPNTFIWEIEVYPGGDVSKPEKFIIHGGPDTQVILDVMGENQIKNTGQEALDSVTIGLGEDDGAGKTGAAEIIERLMAETGVDNEERLIKALKAAGFPYDDMKELNQAVKDGEFPPPGGPTTQLIDFLMTLDEELYEKVQKATVDGDSETVDVDDCVAANERLAALLQILFPDENLSAFHDGEIDAYIKFNNTRYILDYARPESGKAHLKKFEGEYSEDKVETV
ncbi:MAG: hypothetical protein ACREA0_31905, partial [bacterium]